MATKNRTVKPVKSKTAQAIDYMTEHGVTPYAAAQAIGVAPTAVYKRLALLKATADQRCPHCGQLIKDEA